MSVREMKPRIDFKPGRTRIYADRKVGVPFYDQGGGKAYFQFIKYTNARADYDFSSCVAAGTTFEIECSHWDSALAAYTALRPLLRAINTYRPDPPDADTPMALGL